MAKETMSPVERWKAVLTRRNPDRIPMDYWATDEFTNKLLRHLGCSYEEMLQRMHIDKPLPLGGKYMGPKHADNEDHWGVKYRRVNYGTGYYDEVIYSPMAQYASVDEIQAKFQFPTIDYWDFSHLPKEIQGQENCPIQGGGSEPFLQYKYLRGEQQAFMDLIENPDIVEFVLGKIFDLAYQYTFRIFETIPGKVLLTYIAEDFGAQNGLMISKEQIRRFMLPGMKRMVELTRQHGSYVFTHSDGAIRDIIPDLISMGAQILNPIQWRCRYMDREGLKKDFGVQLIFHGAMDNQMTLPFGTMEDVKREVEDNLRILGNGGGYILAPCHNIQVVSPVENIIAMYEHGYHLGWSG